MASGSDTGSGEKSIIPIGGQEGDRSEEELDLKDVMGMPDGGSHKEQKGGVVDDIERQYLGRWNGTKNES